jgi:uncharacterized membrane protein YfcA
MSDILIPFAGWLWWALIATLGLIVGLIAGMFGIGGGFILIPMLNVLFAVPADVAVGTGICMTIGTGIAAFRRHRRLKQGEVKIDWIMLAGALLGVGAGAHTVSYLSHRGLLHIGGHIVPAVEFWIASAYILVLCFVAAFMIRDALVRPSGTARFHGPLMRVRLPPMTLLSAANRPISIPMLAYLGLVVGYLSGLMGLGGGVMLMPVLVLGMGMPIKMAAGTGIILLVATSMTGTIAHALLGHVHLGMAVVLLAGSTLGAPIGATITSNTSGSRLRGVFGVLVLVTAATVLWNLVKVILSH